MKTWGKVQILSLCGIFMAVAALLGIYSYFVPVTDAYGGAAENGTKTETAGLAVLSAKPIATETENTLSICQANCEASAHPESSNQPEGVPTDPTQPASAPADSEQLLPPQITLPPALNPETDPSKNPRLTPRPVQPDPCGCSPDRHCLMSTNKVCPVRNLN